MADNSKNGLGCLYVEVGNITLIDKSDLKYSEMLSTHLPAHGDILRHAVKKQWFARMDPITSMTTSALYSDTMKDGSIIHADALYSTIFEALEQQISQLGPSNAHTPYLQQSYDMLASIYGPGTYYSGPMDGGEPWRWSHFHMNIQEPVSADGDIQMNSLYTRYEKLTLVADMSKYSNSPYFTAAGAYDTVATRLLWIQGIESMWRGENIYTNNEKTTTSTGKTINKSMFYDGVFSYTKPVKTNGPGAITEYSTASGFKYARSESTYNFYVPSYEKAISADEVLESWLPNLHAFLSERWSENLDSDHSIFDKLIKLGGLLQEMFVDVLNSSGQKIGEKDNGQYYEKWAERWNSVGLSGIAADTVLMEEFRELAVRYFHVVFPTADLEQLMGFNEGANVFPMSNTLEFSTDGASQFANILQDLQLSSLLKAEIIKDNRPLNTAGSFELPYAGSSVNTAAAEFESLSGMPTNSSFKDANYVYSRDADGSPKIRGDNKVRSLDVTGWIHEYMPLSPSTTLEIDPTSDISQEMMTEIATFLGVRSEEAMTLYQGQDASTILAVTLSLFNASMETMFKSATRNYRQILDGQEAHSETVCYRIEKLRNGKVVQNFYFGKNRESQFIEFVDTQVKYNTFYTYKVYAYQAVFGTEYQYRNLQFVGEPEAVEKPKELCSDTNYEAWYDANVAQNPPIYNDYAAIETYKNIHNCPMYEYGGNGVPNKKGGAATDLIVPREHLAATMEVYTRPKIHLVEVPYVDFPNMKIHDHPPVPPETKIYPFYAVSDKIQIHLSPGIGEAKLKPMPIETNDINCFLNMMTAQRLNDPELDKFLQKVDAQKTAGESLTDEQLLDFIKLNFRTDDFLAGYDVYRLAKRPTSYADFAGRRLARVSCDVDPETPGIAQYLLFEDNIRPNVKYYYTFRAIDIHGNISNPTQVYEVEMVDDAGTVWQKIDVIEFEEKKPAQPTRPLKRFMSVSPSEIQSILNMELNTLSQLMSLKNPGIASNDGKAVTVEGKSKEGKPKLALPGNLLGRSESPVWGKQFKIRLTSRDTGKKIDINFNFKYEFEASRVLNLAGQIKEELSAKGVKMSSLTTAQQVAQALQTECFVPDPAAAGATVTAVTDFSSIFNGSATTTATATDATVEVVYEMPTVTIVGGDY